MHHVRLSSANAFNLDKAEILTLHHTIPTFNDLTKKAFEKIVDKGENAGNQHFLLFTQCCLPFPKRISVF